MPSANKNCLLFKSGKWKISQDCPPESHMSAYWRNVSYLIDSHSVPCQSGAQAHGLDGGVVK